MNIIACMVSTPKPRVQGHETQTTCMIDQGLVCILNNLAEILDQIICIGALSFPYYK
jgi:hypothetical protein